MSRHGILHRVVDEIGFSHGADARSSSVQWTGETEFQVPSQQVNP
jgi:hypothetical protein